MPGKWSPPSHASLKALLFHPYWTKYKTSKGTQGVQGRYDAELPPFISIVRHPGHPVILGKEKQRPSLLVCKQTLCFRAWDFQKRKLTRSEPDPSFSESLLKTAFQLDWASFSTPDETWFASQAAWHRRRNRPKAENGKNLAEKRDGPQPEMGKK